MTLAEFWFLSTELGGVKPAAAVQNKNKDNKIISLSYGRLKVRKKPPSRRDGVRRDKDATGQQRRWL